MDFDLIYVDYFVVGITLPKTLKLLPTEPKNSLKIVTGDQQGVLQANTLKNDEMQLVFKTLPGDPISSLHLAGSQDGAIDKIFVSTGVEVRGYTKKGKLFLSLETNLVEPITCMWVYEADLIVAGNHCVTHYRDCKEVGSFVCGDIIVDIAGIILPKSNRVICMLACGGGAIRAVERGRPLAAARLPSGPQVFLSPMHQSMKHFVICGDNEGKLHYVALDREHGSVVINEFVGLNTHFGITALGWWEGIEKVNNACIILVALSDGTILICDIHPDEPSQKINIVYSYRCGESITSISGWNENVVIASRSGKIFGLAPPISPEASSTKLNQLKNEIEDLENKVEKERTRYQFATQPLSQGLSAIPALQISEEWGPIENDGAKRMCISLEAPLDTLLLQSSAPLQLLDAPPNTALLTRAHNSNKSNNLLATYRCQANTQKIEMRIGTEFEGLEYAGDLKIYVTPFLQPKCSQLIVKHIPPLAWHVPSQEYEKSYEHNILNVQGSFSKAEMHAWLTWLLPNVPSKPLPTNENLIFNCPIIKTFLECSYQKGVAEFKSNNITTIGIVKDFLSKEATKKKVRLEISSTINDNSIFKCIMVLHPFMVKAFKKLKEEKLLKALRELEVDLNDEQNERKICKEYKELLNKPINKEDNAKCLSLNQLKGIIMNWFKDRNKLKGINVKGQLVQLEEILNEYKLESLISFLENQFQSSYLQ